MKLLSLLNLLCIESLCVLFVCGEYANILKGELNSLFKEIGFSPSCVAKTLASCENSESSDALTETQPQNAFKGDPTPSRPRNCADLFNSGDKESGIRSVYPFACCESHSVPVFCDQTTDGGGWTVIQHRELVLQRENFFRNWVEYEIGFGKLDGEFWLGLKNIHALVSNTLMELRVDLEDFEGNKKWAKYEYFYIGDASDKYRLDLGPYSGTAGDSLTYHNQQQFTTKDRDNDPSTSHSGNCALRFKGAWWHKDCHLSNLNGLPHQGDHPSFADGINWEEFRGYHHSMKTTSLSLRPIF